MSKGARAELERLVQDIDRAHPGWPGSEIEAELERLAPVRYGDWKANTPNPGARLRQVHRWRTGAQAPPKRPANRPLYHQLWPVGERQRQDIDASFSARSTGNRASHRLFLHNCSEETLREIRVRISGKEVGYEPALAPGRFTEVPWFKNPAILAGAMASPPHERLIHSLRVDFAVAKGTRAGSLEGELRLDSSDGWVSFASSDELSKELF